MAHNNLLLRIQRGLNTNLAHINPCHENQCGLQEIIVAYINRTLQFTHLVALYFVHILPDCRTSTQDLRGCWNGTWQSLRGNQFISHPNRGSSMVHCFVDRNAQREHSRQLMQTCLVQLPILVINFYFHGVWLSAELITDTKKTRDQKEIGLRVEIMLAILDSVANKYGQVLYDHLMRKRIFSSIVSMIFI